MALYRRQSFQVPCLSVFSRRIRLLYSARHHTRPAKPGETYVNNCRKPYFLIGSCMGLLYRRRNLMLNHIHSYMACGSGFEVFNGNRICVKLHVRLKTHGVENRPIFDSDSRSRKSATVFDLKNRRRFSTPKTDMVEKR